LLVNFGFKLVTFGPLSVNFGLKLITFGPLSVNFGLKLITFGLLLVNLGLKLVTFGLLLTNFGVFSRESSLFPGENWLAFARIVESSERSCSRKITHRRLSHHRSFAKIVFVFRRI